MDQAKATSVNKLVARASQDADVLAVILFGSVARGDQTASADPSHLQDTPPARALLRLITGYWVSRAIYVMAKLGIADLLRDGPEGSEVLAQATCTDARALYRVLRTLASVGVLVEDEAARFGLTPTGACLQTGVPGSFRTLAAHPIRAVLTLSAGHPRDELGPVPANARIERFVPHAAVLKRSGLLVSHAGHGIVAKALYDGVPMVLVPWSRDQPGVAARAAALWVAEVSSISTASG